MRKWCAWHPDPMDVVDKVYSDKRLDEMIRAHREAQADAQKAYEERLANEGAAGPSGEGQGTEGQEADGGQGADGADGADGAEGPSGAEHEGQEADSGQGADGADGAEHEGQGQGPEGALGVGP
jgi:hypothetical protein